eukprot:TRINITY_DN2088_c0_g1_i2.p1 TRINITY_DN2088_c0_g1~~TRINITY_DN2088_c0_g1_i2.p1  ORF type:complete len:187 (-),score=29.88 TRINITY_DN2088_c0_g1_i2:19-579(-)
MGNAPSIPDDQLTEYEECTFFTRKEVLKVHGRFQDLLKECPPVVAGSDKPKIPVDVVTSIPELAVNPFRHRICEVFSDDGSGDLYFEDFLNLFSIFSESAGYNFKLFYLFRIYDFDNDGFIGAEDLNLLVNILTNAGLDEDQSTFVVERLLEEGDIDGNGNLSFDEFNKIMSRLPDFATKFRIRLV